MINEPSYKLVFVKWQDSYGVSPVWQEIRAVQVDAHYCYSVGWVVAESSDCLVIVPHVSPANEHIAAPEQGTGDMSIPKRSIVNLVELQVELPE
jgi:hypothetical protein